MSDHQDKQHKSSPLVQAAENFILQYVESLDGLRILLLLKEFPLKEWSEDSITKELRSSHSLIGARLKTFIVHQFIVEKEENYFLNLEHKDLTEILETLAELLRVYPGRVYELIYSKQTVKLQCFADAFKIKKKEGS